MIKNILSDIGGIGIYGIIALSMFFGVFVAMLIKVCAMKRTHARHMGALPLETDHPFNPQGDHHE